MVKCLICETTRNKHLLIKDTPELEGVCWGCYWNIPTHIRDEQKKRFLIVQANMKRRKYGN